MGLDQASQSPPRDDSVHFVQEALAPRLLVIGLKTDAVKGHLTHSNLAGRLNLITKDLPSVQDLIRGSLKPLQKIPG
jgi:hypothetical protein